MRLILMQGYTTENRGVPGSSPGLAIAEGAFRLVTLGTDFKFSARFAGRRFQSISGTS
jgi:hypothetical protein